MHVINIAIILIISIIEGAALIELIILTWSWGY